MGKGKLITILLAGVSLLLLGVLAGYVRFGAPVAAQGGCCGSKGCPAVAGTKN